VALLLLALAGCSPALRLSVEGDRRCRLQAQQAWLPLRPWTALNCRRTVEAELARERLLAEQRQRQDRERREVEQRRCRQEREVIQALVARFDSQQASLAQLLAERYQPAPAPRPLSPEERRSLPIYDQELLDERHGADLAAWRSREEVRSRQWERRQASAVAVARARLNALSGELGAIDGRLLARQNPPELNLEVVRQRTACR
jgi:hypothetical protein